MLRSNTGAEACVNQNILIINLHIDETGISCINTHFSASKLNTYFKYITKCDKGLFTNTWRPGRNAPLKNILITADFIANVGVNVVMIHDTRV